MIISICSLKGGVGKTTTAMYLATCAHQDGARPIVLDADNERSAMFWAREAGEALRFEVIEANPNGLARQARGMAEEGYTVIVDNPPNQRDILWGSAMVADRVVVPVAPTHLDINRLRSTLEMLLDVESTRRVMDTRILFTRWVEREVLAREANELLGSFPVLDARVRNLVTYKKSFGTMPDYPDEYEAVWKELR